MSPLAEAFEDLGQIREKLSEIDSLLPELQAATADVDDDVLSVHVARTRRAITDAWESITVAGNHTARRIQLDKELERGGGSDLDGLNAAASQGG